MYAIRSYYVYDYCHVGHARMLIVFDVVRRYLRWRGYDVTFVRNITDIDPGFSRTSSHRIVELDSSALRVV